MFSVIMVCGIRACFTMVCVLTCNRQNRCLIYLLVLQEKRIILPLPLELRIIKFSVKPVFIKQLFMRTLFYYVTLIHNEYKVGGFYR